VISKTLRRLCFPAVLFFILLQPISAGGSKEDFGYQQVEGLENWDYQYDIREYEPDTYNLVIRGIDKAGNTYLEGPFNIEIDPDSDLPIVAISNPRSLSRVGGNLNIIGSAIDDDGIDRVEIKIDDGEFFKSEGQDFWSHFLDVDTIEDGLHTVTAKAFDIHGVEGRERSVKFNLDTTKPFHEVISHQSGAILNGRVDILGTVRDANGLSRFTYSNDGGNTFNPLKLKYNKEIESYHFKIRIDTRKLPDGPQVYWFSSTDNTGSVGTAAFLFFVDNKSPEIEVLSPAVDEEVNGLIHIGGKVDDEIGIDTLLIRVGNNVPEEIPLTPGNPYWFREINTTGLRSGSMKVTLNATDITGNESELKYNILINNELDKPVVRLDFPIQDAVLYDEVYFSGSISDDDGSAALLFSIDDSEPVQINTEQAFYHDLNDIGPGPHRLTLFGRDFNGIESAAIKTDFTVVGAMPEIELLEAIVSGLPTNFTSGIEFDRYQTNTIKGKIGHENKLEYTDFRFNEGEWQKLKIVSVPDSTVDTFEIALPAAIPFGISTLSVRAKDLYHEEVVISRFLYVFNRSKIGEEPGIYYKDLRVSEDGSVDLRSGGDFNLFFQGDTIDTAVLSEEAPEVLLIKSEQFLSIQQGGQGITGPLHILITTERGHEYSFGPFRFITDSAPPKLNLELPKIGERINGSLKIKGSAVEENEIIIAEYSLDGGGTYNDIPGRVTIDNDGKYFLEGEVGQGELTAGGNTVIFRVTDAAGNASHKVIPFNFGNKVPIVTPEGEKPVLPPVTFGYPDFGAEIGGLVDITGFIQDNTLVEEIRSVLDGGEPVSIEPDESFLLTFEDLDPGRHKIVLQPVGAEGQVGPKAELEFFKLADKPLLSINSLAYEEKETDFVPGIKIIGEQKPVLIGQIETDSKVEGLEYKINGGEPKKTTPKKVPETDLFSFQVPLPPGLPFGLNTLEINGTIAFSESISMATIFFNTAPDDTLSDEEGVHFIDSRIGFENRINLTGKNSITGYFNGRSLESARLVPEDDSLLLSVKGNRVGLELLEDGFTDEKVLEVTTVDGDVFTSEPLYFFKDGRSPIIRIDTPEPDLWVGDSLFISGEVEDNVRLINLEYSLDNGESFSRLYIGAAEGESAEEQENTKGIQFSQKISLKDQDDGGVTLILKAVDFNGNTVWKYIPVNKDTESPEISLILPPAEDSVNGNVTIAGLVKDAGTVIDILGSDDGENFVSLGDSRFFNRDVDFSEYNTIPDTVFVKAVDKSGNISVINSAFGIDQSKDKPFVEIQIPEENAILRNDFNISGMVFDDDEVSAIFYRIDGGETIQMNGSTNFSIEIALSEITDNEHIVEVWAEDLGGVQSDIASTSFLISKEEPVSQVIYPALMAINKGLITFEGTAADENGIKEVWVSYDNGNSFYRAEGTDTWQYILDTRVLKDGIQSVLIKAIDNLDSEGLTTTLVNIDNTPPEVKLDNPREGEIVYDQLKLDGLAQDNLSLEGINVYIEPLNLQSSGQGPYISHQIDADGIFLENVDISALEPGWYNLRLEAIDAADNSSSLAVNFIAAERTSFDRLELMFPSEGEVISGHFSVEGQIVSRDHIDKIILHVDDDVFGTIPVNENGFFSLQIKSGELSEGSHTFQLKSNPAGEYSLESSVRRVEYIREGGWIDVNNFSTGDFISQRPYLLGSAGYYIDPIDESDEAAFLEYQQKLKLHEIEKVEVSLDNGKTFSEAKGEEEWKYRIETQTLPDGILPVLIRAHFVNGDYAVKKSVLMVDETPPEVTMLTPEEGERFNEVIDLSGFASDANGLTDIGVTLRAGDKSRYAVPEFIQGLYAEAHYLGVTYADIGMGLTFFDDNVKLQGQIGRSPSGRFSGLVIGTKLLANVLTLPFGFFFGPDWDFFSMSLAVGANFSYFTMSGDEIAFTGEGLVLGALVGQVEFARFSFPRMRSFSSYSLYTEGSVWFISSDVKGGKLFRLAFGTRVGIL
jgi:hypothetical protein